MAPEFAVIRDHFESDEKLRAFRFGFDFRFIPNTHIIMCSFDRIRWPAGAELSKAK